MPSFFLAQPTIRDSFGGVFSYGQTESVIENSFGTDETTADRGVPQIVSADKNDIRKRRNTIYFATIAVKELQKVFRITTTNNNLVSLHIFLLFFMTNYFCSHFQSLCPALGVPRTFIIMHNIFTTFAQHLSMQILAN